MKDAWWWVEAEKTCPNEIGQPTRLFPSFEKNILQPPNNCRQRQEKTKGPSKPQLKRRISYARKWKLKMLPRPTPSQSRPNPM